LGESWSASSIDWLVMVVAMMLPVVLGSARVVAARSLWGRRHRAIGGFLIGYLGVWLAVGFAVAAAGLAVVHLVGETPSVVSAAGFLVAAAWQLTAFKQRALRSCHRKPILALRGWAADEDCIRYGLFIGSRCVFSCWALMLACTLSGHSIISMAGVSFLAVSERYTFRPDRALSIWVLGGLALVAGGPILIAAVA
jgi:predicted metal-binding membrane protein